jgi:uncharacterized protein
MKNIREKHIAVIGVSKRPEKYGYKIFSSLLNSGFHVSGVHPQTGELFGRKIYKSLEETESVPDMVITVVPPESTEKIVEQCQKLGIKEIWMQPGSESEAAVKKAKEYGMDVVFNACFMVKNNIW